MIKRVSHENSILSFYRTHRRFPTITETMKICRLSSRSSAFYQIKKLVTKGLLIKDTNGRLSLGKNFASLKFLGAIQAGFASPVEEELADTISIGEYLIRHKESSYLLEVHGDSMKDAGIQHGDMVIFERGADPNVGDIVVALTENGYTLKYLRKIKSRIYLEAANSKYPDIYPLEGQIIGVVTASFRKYRKS